MRLMDRPVACARSLTRRIRRPARVVFTVSLLGLLPSAAFAHGEIVAWGNNQAGQCGVPNALNSKYVAVQAGDCFSVGLKADGSVVVWGDDRHGQCAVPEPNADFTAIAGGFDYCYGLKKDGSIVAWGSRFHKQCVVPGPNAD